MNHAEMLEHLLVVGVDPHRESLDVVGIGFPEEILLDTAYDNTPAGHRALLAQGRALAATHHLTLVFGLEDSGNYGYTLGRYLTREGCVVKEVNPRLTNRQRAFYGQDKTNRLDALATAAIVLRAYERLPAVTVVSEATAAVRELSRYREQLVKEQTAHLNQLHTRLAQQYTQYKNFFSQVGGVTALAFWATYPGPADLQDVTVDALADFLYEQSHQRLGRQGSQAKAQQILAQVESQREAERDLLYEAQGHVIRDLAQRLLQLKRSLHALEQQLTALIPTTGQQLQTFNGLGVVLAGVLIGETLDTARFDHDKDKFARYNGSAPATKGTGQHTRQVENRWCNRRLKHALSQLALNARRGEPLSQVYYQQCLARGLSPAAAHKRLMRRLSDIIFAMLRDRTAYDPATHRRKQERHKAEGKSVASAVDPQVSLALFPSHGTVPVYHTREELSKVVPT